MKSFVFPVAGYQGFRDFWNLPCEFVEAVNQRRNGWSAVSLLTLADGRGGSHRFYVKRQENQLRHSLRHLNGALTYEYEVDALRRAALWQWPAAQLVAYGFQYSGAIQRGILVTRAIECPSMLAYQFQPLDWSPYLQFLRAAGDRILGMHMQRWQHGALYPGHLFVNLESGSSHLIDFERTRRRLTANAAAEADLTQFLKRTDWLPDAALRALFSAHRRHMPAVMRRLSRKFPHRINALQE